MTQPQFFFDERGDPHPCRAGCQLGEARSTLVQAGRIMEQAQRLAGRTQEGTIVSQAMWCDQGQHAFSARDPKAEHWERNGTDPVSGKKVTVPWDVCGEHMQAINGRLAALEAETNPGHAIPGSPND
jgi:hypothetical protein